MVFDGSPNTITQSPAGDLFAVSVVGCLLGYSSCLVVWIPLFLDPSDGVFGRFDLAALCGCRTLNFCLFVTHNLWSGAQIDPLHEHNPKQAHQAAACGSTEQLLPAEDPFQKVVAELLKGASPGSAALANKAEGNT